jgi:hypothetical protein
MVDSRKGEVMVDRIDNLVEDVHGIKQKVSDLSERFDAVDAAIREQREYTEFASGRMAERFERLQLGFDRLEAKVDQRFEQVDDRIGRFEAKVDQRFERIERKLDIVINARPARRPPKRRR